MNARYFDIGLAIFSVLAVCTSSPVFADANWVHAPYAQTAGSTGMRLTDLVGDGCGQDLVTSRGMTLDMVYAEPAAGQLRRTVPTAATGLGLAVGDFDRTSGMDVAVAEQTAGTVSIYYNYGQGRLYDPSQTVITAPGGPGNMAIAAGDFDNDGDADLMLYTQSLNALHFLQNTNSSFALRASVSTECGIISSPNLLVNDFNRDGSLDIAATCNSISPRSAHLAIWFRDPANPYSFPYTAYTTLPQAQDTSGNRRVGEAAIGDFNKDGWTDFAVASTYTHLGPELHAVSYYSGASLATTNNVSLAASPNFMGDIRKLAAADFNGDGATDLVTAGNGGDFMRVVVSPGDGTFNLSQVYYHTQSAPVGAIAVGDVLGGTDSASCLGDGRPDVLYWELGNVHVLVSPGPEPLLSDGFED
jgi:hypothetical protein